MPRPSASTKAAQRNGCLEATKSKVPNGNCVFSQGTVGCSINSSTSPGLSASTPRARHAVSAPGVRDRVNVRPAPNTSATTSVSFFCGNSKTKPSCLGTNVSRAVNCVSSVALPAPPMVRPQTRCPNGCSPSARSTTPCAVRWAVKLGGFHLVCSPKLNSCGASAARGAWGVPPAFWASRLAMAADRKDRPAAQNRLPAFGRAHQLATGAVKRPNRIGGD